MHDGLNDAVDGVLLQVNPYAGTDVDERTVLRGLNGFNDVFAVAMQSGMHLDKVKKIIERLQQSHVIRSLREWSPLHWCEACDVPLMSEFCGLCGATSENKISLRPPSNPKIIDKFYSNALRSVGVAAAGNMVVNAFRQSGIQKFELIRGRKLAEFAFDEAEQCWRLQCDYGVHLEPSNRPEVDRQVILERILEANSARMTALEQAALGVVRTELGKLNADVKPMFCHSGGKDSLVAFDLLIKAPSRAAHRAINVLSSELGIDFPETRAFIELDIARYPGPVHFHYYSHKEIFLKTMEKIGPPALGNYWCGPQSRLPAKKIVRALYNDEPYISIKGHRKRESMEKMLWASEEAIYVQRDVFENEKALNPIWNWSDLEAWLYIHKHRLKYHPIYDTGVQRLVCVMCPIHSDAEQHLINERNPELIRDFERLLRRWKEKLNLPEEWITRRLWRTINSKSSVGSGTSTWSNMARIAALLNHVTFVELTDTKPKAENDQGCLTISGMIRTPVVIPALKKYLRVTVGNAVEESDGAIRCGDVHITLDEPNTVTVVSLSRASAQKMATRVSELINVYINCVGCGFCVDECDSLIIADGRVQANDHAEGNCSKCHSFMEVCPVSRSRFVNFSHLFSGLRKSSGGTANQKR